MFAQKSKSIQKFLLLSLMLLCAAVGCQSKTPTSPDDSTGQTSPSTDTPRESKPSAEQTPPINIVIDQPPATATVSGNISVVGWEHEFVPSKEHSQDGNYYFPDEPDFGLSVSYWGVESTDKQWIHAGATFPTLGIGWAPVVNSTFEPRTAALRFDPEKGWGFEHANIPPGTYCFIVGWKPNYFQRVWKVVEPGADLEIDFEIDLRKVGAAEITAPEDSQVWYQFQTPSRISDDPPNSDNYELFEKNGWSISEWNVNLESGKAVLAGMAPGHYRFFCSKSKQPIDVVIEANATSTIHFEE